MRPSALAFIVLAFATDLLLAQNPTGGATPPTTPPAGAPTQGNQQTPPRRAPRPYAQVITDKAVTDAGVFAVHKVEDRWYFELPDSLLGRDHLLVTRIAGVPAGIGGFLSAGSSVNERLVRFERSGDRILLRSLATDAYADDSLETLPGSLGEAADLLDASALARAAFGDRVVDFYAHTARLEAAAAARAVTDWERARYFERI